MEGGGRGEGVLSLSGACHDLDLLPHAVHGSDVMDITCVFRSNHKRQVALEIARSICAAGRALQRKLACLQTCQKPLPSK